MNYDALELHVDEEPWFDRTLCACGSMHLVVDGKPIGCPFDIEAYRRRDNAVIAGGLLAVALAVVLLARIRALLRRRHA